jgi:cbb3-type cytochrome oxidase maturation protein
MTTLYIVLPLALLVASGAVAAFIWATRDGQFDDLDTPARRILCDDPAPRQPARRRILQRADD